MNMLSWSVIEDRCLWCEDRNVKQSRVVAQMKDNPDWPQSAKHWLVACNGCGARGPWGTTKNEARHRWQLVHGKSDSREIRKETE